MAGRPGCPGREGALRRGEGGGGGAIFKLGETAIELSPAVLESRQRAALCARVARAGRDNGRLMREPRVGAPPASPLAPPTPGSRALAWGSGRRSPRPCRGAGVSGIRGLLGRGLRWDSHGPPFPGPRHSSASPGSVASGPGAGKEDVGVQGSARARDPKPKGKGGGRGGRGMGGSGPFLLSAARLSPYVGDCPPGPASAQEHLCSGPHPPQEPGGRPAPAREAARAPARTFP